MEATGTSAPAQAAAPLDVRILDVVREMLAEQGKERLGAKATPSSSFERDLGLQSLDLVELVVRCETRLDVEIPDEIADVADTAASWAKAIQQGTEDKAARSEYRIVPPSGDAAPPPVHARNLVEVLNYQADASAGRIHIHLLEQGGGQGLTAAQILEAATVVARGLISEGLKRNQTVAILLPTGADFFAAFFGVAMAGGIPVPIYPPAPGASLARYVERQIHVLRNAEVKYLIVFNQVRPVSRVVSVNLRNVDVFTIADLTDTGLHSSCRLPEPSDVALIQYTSGTTADAKGSVLTHASVLANLRAIGQATGVRGDDAVVTWLPLASDLGLVGCWLFSLYHGLPLTVIPPQEFLERPESWLWAIHDSRGTLSAAPNFAYELCARRIPMWSIEGIDLSCWRTAVNAGEQVLPSTVEAFTRRFASSGFRAEAMTPCYGLSESSVALTIPPPDRGPLLSGGVFSTGPALPGHEIRIGDNGRIQFRGPSRCKEYQHNPRLTESSIHDGWMDTGDTGFIENGELYVTGRANDVIIREGRPISPELVEAAAAKAPGVRPSGVAVIGAPDKERGSEKLVVIAETTAVEESDIPRVDAEVRTAVKSLLGEFPDEVCLIPPNTLPKTSNGKIRRGEARSLYRDGKLGAPVPAPWVEMTTLWWRNLGALAKRTAKQMKRSARSALFGTVARGYAAAAGTSRPTATRLLSIIGRRATHSGSHLKGPAVVVANRAARLDPLALVSVIQGDVTLAGDSALHALPEWIASMLSPLVAHSPAELEAALKRGGVVVAFPDSPIGISARRCRIRLRALGAAIAAGAPVIPVAMQERRGIFVSRGAPPIATQDGLSARDLREKVKEAIHAIYA
ncbi:MAG: AMP-binding protein [Acidobacteria bacterium]|nr:AMP-binding protein [Acidobacteriota bacterium]